MKFNSLIIYLLAAFTTAGCLYKTSHLASTTAAETTLQRLLQGNERFSTLKPIHPDETLKRLKDVAEEQHPFAIVVCCSDSRVAPELIFDEGIGDLFVIRTAGNLLSGIELGSIEYAIEHLGVNLIIVMGHKNCGAVKAFIDGGETPGHINDIIDSIKQEVEIKAIPINNTNRLDDFIKGNVRHGIKQLVLQSGIISEKVRNGQVEIVGVMYNLDDFKVSILNE